MPQYQTDVVGHGYAWQRFVRAQSKGRLGGAYLFVGPAGIGKRTFANSLVQALFCEHPADDQLRACGQCPSCRQVVAGSHPDCDAVELPADRTFIPIELLIGSPEHRMREGICHKIALTPMQASRRVAIIDDADYLRVEGANCLLKTLEEPPPGAMLILISTSPQRQLPTIRSRCQLVRFAGLSTEEVEQVLLREGDAADAGEARRLAELSQGSVALARACADPQWIELRDALLRKLGAIHVGVQETLQQVVDYVDQAKTDASARRTRMKQAARFGADYYRHLARRLSGGAPATTEADLWKAVDQAADRWPGDSRSAAACAIRCIEAVAQVEANANPATWMAAWTEDLGRKAAAE